MDKDLSDRLRIARENSGLKQTEVTELIGLSPVSLSRWENGKRKPTAANITALAKLYRCSVDWLLTGEGEKFPTPRRGLVQVDPPPAIQRLKRFIEGYGPSETGGETQGVPPPGQPDRYRHLEAYRATGPPTGISDEEWQLICNYRCAGDEIKEECFGMLERSAAKSRAKDGGGSDSPEMKSG